MWKVQLFKLNFDEREEQAAAAVVRGGWLTMGEQVVAFESAFGRFLEADGIQCTAVSSCTAALHMAMLALGVKAGDEVVVPALTFVAAANVVRVTGATPVLADSASLDEWNVSAETIERCLSPRTRAVIIVHYAGYPCRMGPIVDLCRRRGIALVEDAAHTPGATLGGRECGTFGDIGCFSFFSNKNLSIGEGGMAVTTDPELHQKLRGLRSHGMTTLTLDRHKGRAITYDVTAPGLNYRMDEIRAAIGLVQLAKLRDGNAQRERLTARYRERFAGSAIAVPFRAMPESMKSACHIMPVLLPEGADRVAVIERLKAAGIQSSIHYPPFWGFTGYQGMYRPEDTPAAADIVRRELTLPLFPTMPEGDVDCVAGTLLDALR